MMRVMKDSGIEWVGDIPKEWSVYPALYAFSEIRTKNTDGAITKALKFYNGTIIPKSNFDADTDEYVADTITNYTVVKPDTIMINGLNLNYDLKSLRVGLVKETGVITSAYLALWPDRCRIIPEYATYLFKGYETKMAFHNMGAGIRKTLGFREFKRQPILLPDLSEQQQIVSFLDAECSRIDAVIEQTRASIEEYKKLKQSVITQAVTKGIRPNRKMKDSGIEWIGEIPEEWDIIISRFVIDNIGDVDHYMPESVSEGIPYVMTGDLAETLSKVNFTNCKHISYEDYKILSKKISPNIGDVIFARYATIGTVCYIDCHKEYIVSYSCVIVQPQKSKLNGKYLYHYFKSQAFQEDVKQYITSNTQANIGIEAIYRSKIVVPSISEQLEIADYLSDKCAEIDRLISVKQQLLAELESYKKSLIYEYVTGKKEVM